MQFGQGRHKLAGCISAGSLLRHLQFHFFRSGKSLIIRKQAVYIVNCNYMLSS